MEPPKTLAWTSVQKPPGSSETTVPRCPRRAISSTIRAPIELPTTSTPARPSATIHCWRASVSAAMVARPLTAGSPAKPGRSTATTSRAALSAGTTVVPVAGAGAESVDQEQGLAGTSSYRAHGGSAVGTTGARAHAVGRPGCQLVRPF